MKRLRIFLAAVALTLPIAALARAPAYTSPGADRALVRFSWRMTVAGDVTCRPRTEEELAKLPVHMRTPEVCTPDPANYLLVMQLDEAAADTLPLLRGGIRGDRPLFVLEERALPPGRHRVRLELQRSSDASGLGILAAMDTVLELLPGRVQLVSLDAASGRFTVRSSAGRH